MRGLPARALVSQAVSKQKSPHCQVLRLALFFPTSPLASPYTERRRDRENLKNMSALLGWSSRLRVPVSTWLGS